jgi:hypothetical protein
LRPEQRAGTSSERDWNEIEDGVGVPPRFAM